MQAEASLRYVAVIAVLAVSAFAQVTGDRFVAALRAKYGPPVARQTFVVPGGEMVVDYAANGNACRIRLPAMAPDKQRPQVQSSRAMDDFIWELVPPSVRGKELNRGAAVSGVNSVSFTYYENVTVSEVFNATGRTGVTVMFRNETCQDPPADRLR